MLHTAASIQRHPFSLPLPFSLSLSLSLSPYLFLSPSLVRTQSQGALRGTCEQSLPALAAIALFANALRICFTYAQAEPGTGEALFDRRRGSRGSHLSLRLLGPSCPLTWKGWHAGNMPSKQCALFPAGPRGRGIDMLRLSLDYKSIGGCDSLWLLLKFSMLVILWW